MSTGWEPPPPPPGWSSQPSPPPPPPRPRSNARVWVIVAVVAVALLVRTHHLSTFPVLVFCALIPSVIVHEVAHGMLALYFGDDTAKRAGRLTLNPVRHIDPFGTILDRKSVV